MIFTGLVVLAVLIIVAGAFCTGLMAGISRGESHAAAACDIAHNRITGPARPITRDDLLKSLGHYQIRPVTPATCMITMTADDRTEVDAFRAYREITGKHHRQ
jgi:hypothetical protein